jgi:integrase
VKRSHIKMSTTRESTPDDNPGKSRLDALALCAARPGGYWRVAKDSTYRRSYRVAEDRLLDYFGKDALLDDLTPDDIQAWRNHLKQSAEEGRYSIRSVNTYLSTARAMLNATGWSDLAAAIQELPKPRPRDKAMSVDTFERMLRHANMRDAAILRLLWESGRRRATICQLRAGAPHRKIYQGPDGLFRFVAHTFEKGERPVLCFAGHEATLAIMLWEASRPDPDSPWLFTHLDRGDPLRPDAITHIFNKLRRRAHVPDSENAFPHACRHAFAQRRLEAFDQRVVADWMGISTQTLIEVYATRNENKLQALFFGDERS